MNGNANTQMHRMGLNPFVMFYIDAMLNVDANANIKSNLFKVCSTLDVCIIITLKFNIVSMVMQTQTHRMGLNSFLMFYIGAMLNVDANTTQLSSVNIPWLMTSLTNFS